jgi:hypothetical protein
MDAKTMTIDTTKKYIIHSYENDIITIEFASNSDVLPEEEYADAYAYEVYILDDENEASMRAIYYFWEEDGTEYLKYREDVTRPDSITTIRIRKIVAMKEGMDIYECLAENEEDNAPDSNLSMGDIC